MTKAKIKQIAFFFKKPIYLKEPLNNPKQIANAPHRVSLISQCEIPIKYQPLCPWLGVALFFYASVDCVK